MPRPLKSRAGLREADASTRSPGPAACILARTARRAGRPRVPATHSAPRTSSRWPAPARRSLHAAAAATAAAPHSVLWTRASAGFQNARLAPASVEIELRLCIIYTAVSTKDSPTFSTHRIPPNACEHMYRFRRPADRMRPRVPLSDRMSCLETEYINQKYTHTFRHAECSRPPRLLAPLVHETPSVWAHISIPPVAAREYRPSPPRGGGVVRPPIRGRAQIPPQPPTWGRGSSAPHKGPGAHQQRQKNPTGPPHPVGL